ncbi:MAG: hypothetical protein WCI67_10645 [Chloroflexales bacterium]
MTLPLSILDLMPIPNGGDGAQAIRSYELVTDAFALSAPAVALPA